jgi:plastocyanin
MPASTRASVRRAVLRAVPVAAFAALAVAPVLAQDDGPAHPAHIHAGTCADLGDVVFPLADVTGGDHGGTPMAVAGTETDGTPAAGADATASPEAERKAVAASTTTVEASLADILAAPHAINVHESAEEIATYIACGDIAGEPEDGVLTIDLAELNDSGYVGEATLTEDGDRTEVAVELYGADGAATPEAGAAEASAVAIVDFAYDPDPVTVPVGGAVTWTNEDAVPHTATARDRAVLQTGTLRQGESFTQTFETAGTFDYFCEFHSGMKGTVVVE